jgi:amino acid adenylation domain-containing protein/FkbM family methyltransferase
MVPAFFVLLDELPLSPNGKINRNALPDPKTDRDTLNTPYAAPEGRNQEILCALFAEILGIATVGAHDKFFELGGHSLLAIRLLARVRAELGVSLPLRSIFDAPTPALLDPLVQQQRNIPERKLAKIERATRNGLMPLSLGQESLWFLDRLRPGGCAYNIPCGLWLEGPIDTLRLHDSIVALVRRHETLRTRFNEIDGVPAQIISESLQIDVPVIDLSDVVEGDRELHARRLLNQEAHRPFDLQNGPLFRSLLIRLETNRHVLLMVIHHAVCDGESVNILWSELAALYNGEILPDLPIQYADFAIWQRDRLQLREYEEELGYWRQALLGMPRSLEWRADRLRGGLDEGGGHVELLLEGDLLESIRRLSVEEGASVFMTLLAAYQALLGRYTGQQDFGVGVPVANRAAMEVSGMTGFFVNTIVLRAELWGDPTFRQFLLRVRERALAGYAHQDLPFERLVEELQPERVLGQTPLFQMLFDFQPGVAPDRFGDASAWPEELVTQTSKFDLVLAVRERAGALLVRAEYSTALFDAVTIERFLGHYRQLLSEAVSSPESKLWELELLTDKERTEQDILQGDDSGDEFGYGSLADLVSVWVERSPEAIAVMYEGERLSYMELDARAERLSRRLRARGVGPEVLVGVCAERSLELVVGLLGVLKAGGAYVPLDPGYPRERLEYMVGDSGVGLVLTQAGLLERVGEWVGVEALVLEEDGEEVLPEVFPGVGVAGENLAYMIYTSGSTGRPKGAMNTHRGIVNRLLWMQSAYGLEAGERVLQKTPFSFDVSVWEFFWPLVSGATIVLAKPEGHRDAEYLVDLIASRSVTTVHFVPSMLEIFLRTAEAGRCGSLRRVICSGEALPLPLLRRFRASFSCPLYNLYGPTEAAVDVTHYECVERADGLVPIGRPVSNTRVHVLDGDQSPVPVGVSGELYLGGVQVGRGYWGRPELTAERFVPDPFGAPGARLYRTGDSARLLPDGNVAYGGRLDSQVKLRGFRIELGEIESALVEHGGVRTAAAAVRETEGGDRQLVAYVVPRRRGVSGAGARTLANGLTVLQQNRGETDFLYREIFESEVYSRHGIVIEPEACVFDVGANIGLFALYAGQRCPGGRIYCFEPLPPIAETLRANVVQCEARVKVLGVGLGEAEGEAEFVYYRGNSIMSGRKSAADRRQDLEMVRQFMGNREEDSEETLELVRERMSGESFRCPLRRLSEVMRAEGVEHIDLLKIDVERAEWQVLGGIDEEDWARIDQVVLEVHDEVEALGSGQTEKLVALLRQRGFTVSWEEDEAMRGVGLYNVYATRYSRERQQQAQARWLERAATAAAAVLTPASLRSHLQQKLPEYMVPAFFVLLDELPLSPNGKINRNALPDPKTDRDTLPSQKAGDEEKTARPQSNIGARLMKIWTALLQADEVEPDNGFFDIGGDSFLAVTLAKKISEEFDLQFKVTLVFAHPTFGSMVRYLTSQIRHTDDPMHTAPEGTSRRFVPESDLHTEARKSAQQNIPDSYEGSVAIIGISCHFPDAPDYAKFWQNLRVGAESIEILTADRLEELGVPRDLASSPRFVPARAALQGKDLFDPKFFNYSARDAEIMDPQLRQLLQHSWAATEDAGYTPNDIADAGVFMSASTNFYASAALPANGIVEVPEQYASWALAQAGTIPTVISYKLGLRGRSVFLHSNCSSSLIALEHAHRTILSGESRHALVGAATLFATEQKGYLHHNGLNFSSDGHVRVFDAAADGMIGGEGVAVLLLKETREAIKDGDHIYALLRGIAINNDGAEKASYYAPSVQGQTRVIEKALGITGIDPGSIGYIEAHGTGTKLGDPVEVAALMEAYGSNKNRERCALGSVKSNVGHLDAVAGLAGCIKTAFILMEGEIPPTLHFKNPNPEINFSDLPFYVPSTLTKWPSTSIPRRASVSSFGIGGTNAHAVLEQFQQTNLPARLSAGPRAYLVPLSARNEERLRVSARNLSDFLASPSVLQTLRPKGEVDLGDLAYTLQVGRVAMSSRVIFIAASLAEFVGKLKQYVEGVEEVPGCFRSSGQNRGSFDGLVGEEDASMLIEKWLTQDKLEQAGRMWTAGYDVPWRKLYQRGEFSRMALPTYPFAEESYWLRYEPSKKSPLSSEPISVVNREKARPNENEDQEQTHPEAIYQNNAAATAKVLGSVVEIVGSVTAAEIGAIDAEGEWSQFGFDSVSLVTLTAVLNERYSLDVTPTIFFEYATPRKLAAYLCELQPSLLVAEDATPIVRPGTLTSMEGPSRGVDREEVAVSFAAGKQEPIAIIGMSGCFPQAEDTDAFWNNLVRAKSCIGEIPANRWDWREIYGDPNTETNKTNNKWGAFLEGIAEFDPLFFGISPREAELMDPQQRLLMTHIWRVIEDAGYSSKSLAGSRTAIFVATSGSGYEGLLAQADVPIESYGFTGLIPSVGPSRMSYLLDLHGPSEPVETACSSSLVAIHRGVQSILNDECSMAIVGGVNTIVSAALHISASKAGMLAEDGLCKTFSSSANGFVRGEGVGMVLLKRLSDAERDGDQIHGVILGSAENHGGRSNSLTAPNPFAQTQVIKMAYERAGIAPTTVGYIEAHGTGTALGDPIEINALKKAFADLASSSGLKDAVSPYCGLGSVKSNIGHLELAAGIAGVFKVLLQMKHKTLAKSLHCEDLNPYIQLDGSPFYVLQEARPWSAMVDDSGRELPRRAGISSFGIGGVNAHILLEEYAPGESLIDKAAPEADPFHVILLSAKNNDRLRDYAARLVRCIEDARFLEQDLPRIAYTLQAGRDAMEARLAITVSSLAELRAMLLRWLNGERTAEIHYGNLKRDKERSMANAIDEDLQKTIVAWMEKRKYSKLMELWVNGNTFAWDALHVGKKPKRISMPTYPFAPDHYWPAIAARIPLDKDQPVTATPLPVRTNALHPLLHENTSTFAGLCFSSWFTGEEIFFDQGGPGSGNAFESLLFLEWARTAVTRTLSSTQQEGDEQSTWQGLEITEAVWGEPLVVRSESGPVHICLEPGEAEEVAFEIFSRGREHGEDNLVDVVHCKGRTRLLHRQEGMAIDLAALQAVVPAPDELVEPGKNMWMGATKERLPYLLARTDSPSPEAAWGLHPVLLRDLLQGAQKLLFKSSGIDRRMDPASLRSIKVHGSADIRWIYVHGSSASATAVDVDLCDEDGNIVVAISGLELIEQLGRVESHVSKPRTNVGVAGAEEAMELLTFAHGWQQADQLYRPPAAPKVLVCFAAEPKHQQSILNAAHRVHPEIEILFVSSMDAQFVGSDCKYTVQRDQAASYQRVFEQIRNDRGHVDGIFYFWPVENRSFVHDYRAPVYVIQALAASGLKCPTMLLAGRVFKAVDECYLESWIGFELSLKLVLPDTKVAVVYEASRSSEDLDLEKWFTRLWRELHAPRIESARYSQGQREVCRTELPGKAIVGERAIRDGGIYLITGGTGGLGAKFALHMAKANRVKLILTGRSPLDESKRAVLESLREFGAQAVYVQADVNNADEMRTGIREATKHLGSIRGVIHAAGVAGSLGILENDAESFERVLQPKVQGTQVLESVLTDQPLDFICYFSSSSAVLGDFGGCDYAIANRFELAYADYWNKAHSGAQGRNRALAICWPHWKEGGMGAAEENSEGAKFYLKSSGQRLLETEEGIETFYKLLGAEGYRHIVIAGQPSRALRFLGVTKDQAQPEEKRVSAARIEAGQNRRPELRGFTIQQCVNWDLKEVASVLLKISREHLEEDENLADFGFDSIGLGDFAQRLRAHFKIDITPSLFFSHPTLAQLGEYLMKTHGVTMESYYHEDNVFQKSDLPLPRRIDEEKQTVKPRLVRSTGAFIRAKDPEIPELIAVIGMSGRFPQARNVEEMWRILETGTNAVTEIPLDRFDWREFYGDPRKDATKTNSKWGGCVPGASEFDPLFFELSPREAEAMDPRQRLLLQESWNALEDAGYGRQQLESQKIGMFVGVEHGDYQHLSELSFGLVSTHDAVLAARLSYFLNLRGPVIALNTTCSSGLVALHQACLSLRAGECDAALVAGVNLIITAYGFLAMGQAGMLSPEGKCYAFDHRANGMVPGDAVAVVALKRLSKAIADKDRICAVIRGSGVNYDGKTNGITAPSGAAQANLLRDVYSRARVDPAKIEYVVTHGTGTQLGDPVEINALNDVFAEHAHDQRFCAITSTKTNFGHSFAASGLVSLIALIQSMRHEIIPASLHCERENEHFHWESSPFYVNTANRSWPARENENRLGTVSAFGMSGTNAHVVVESYDRPLTETPARLPLYLLALSAKSESALFRRIDDLIGALSEGEWSPEDLHAASYTMLCGRHHFDHRCVIVAADREHALHLCRQARKKEKQPNIFFGRIQREFTPQKAILEYADELLRRASVDAAETSKYQELLYALGDLYCLGYDLAWPMLFKLNRPYPISLPGYPFEREHYWAGTKTSIEEAPVSSTPPEHSNGMSRDIKPSREVLERLFQGTVNVGEAKALLDLPQNGSKSHKNG